MPGLSEQEMRGLLEEYASFKSGGAGVEGTKKALQEFASSKYAELGMRERVLKSLGQLETVEGSVPYWLRGQYFGWEFDPFGVAYDKDGGIFLTYQWEPHLYYVNPDRTSVTLINDSLPTDGRRIDYNPMRDSVLVAVGGEVREIDKNGDVLNSLSTGQEGDAGHWSGENKFVLVTSDYAFEMDWTGAELWSLGTSGAKGNGLDELNRPRDICMHSGHYLIADWNNNRLLEDTDGDGVAEEVMVVSEPMNVESVKPTSNIIVSTQFSNEYPWWILFLESVGGDNKLIGSYPGHSNDLSVHPTKPLVALVEHNAVLESSYRGWRHIKPDPQELKPIDGATIAAGGTSTTNPMVVMPYQKMAVHSVGDQTHDVTIERLRTNHNLSIGATAPPVYDDLDSMSLAANTLNTWYTEMPLMVVRLTVENTSGNSGTFHTWVTFK